MALCSTECSKARVLVIGFLSLLVILAAEECGVTMREPQEIETELRMETVAHIAALVGHTVTCQNLPGSQCAMLQEEELNTKLYLLREWAVKDPGWHRLSLAWQQYHSGVSYLKSGKFQLSVTAMQRFILHKIYPYGDVILQQHWQRALALPGPLFRKQRLDLADGLLVYADAQLELAHSKLNMVVLEEALQTLELSIAIREAEGDQDSARSSHGYAQSLRVEIGYAISDILPQLRIPELQHQLDVRGVAYPDLKERPELLQLLVPALQLPVSMEGDQILVHNASNTRYFMSQHENEDPPSYLHRVLTMIVKGIDPVLMTGMQPPCPYQLRADAECPSYIPDWNFITAPLRQNVTERKCDTGNELPDLDSSAQGEDDTANRSWKLLHNLRIPGTGSPPSEKKTGKKAAQSADEQLRREMQELLKPASAAAANAAAPPGPELSRPYSVCRNVLSSVAKLSRCQGSACLDICDLLDGLLELHDADLENFLNRNPVFNGNEPLHRVYASLGSMASSAQGAAPSGEGSLEPGSEASEEVAQPQPAPAAAAGPLGGFHLGAVLGAVSEEAARSERDRQLQEQLVRRAKETTGQYQDDPLVPLTLGACILAGCAVYLGRRHRRSLSRVLTGWLASPNSTTSTSLGTSISKERQAAAAALRAVLARSEVGISELETALEAAEATDVEGPLVRRGKQALTLRRRRERDAAEAVRMKAKAAREKEAARVRREEKARVKEESRARKEAAKRDTELRRSENGDAAIQRSRSDPPARQAAPNVSEAEDQKDGVADVKPSRRPSISLTASSSSVSEDQPSVSRSTSSASSRTALSEDTPPQQKSRRKPPSRRSSLNLSDSASSRNDDSLAVELKAASAAAAAAAAKEKASSKVLGVPGLADPVDMDEVSPPPQYSLPTSPPPAAKPLTAQAPIEGPKDAPAPSVAHTKSTSFKGTSSTTTATTYALASKARPARASASLGPTAADRLRAKSEPVLSAADIAAATAAAAFATSAKPAPAVPKQQQQQQELAQATATPQRTPSQPAASAPAPSSAAASNAVPVHVRGNSATTASAPAWGGGGKAWSGARLNQPVRTAAPPGFPAHQQEVSMDHGQSEAMGCNIGGARSDPLLPVPARSHDYSVNSATGLSGDLTYDYLSELSQQGLPQVQPVTVAHEGLLGNGGGVGGLAGDSLFPNLASIWNNHPAPAAGGLFSSTAPFGGTTTQRMMPPMSTLPMDSYHPFGSSSIWGATHLGSGAPASAGLDLSHLLPDSLDSLRWPLTSPQQASINSQADSHGFLPQ